MADRTDAPLSEKYENREWKQTSENTAIVTNVVTENCSDLQ